MPSASITSGFFVSFIKERIRRVVSLLKPIPHPASIAVDFSAESRMAGKAEKDISFKEVDEIFILCEFAKEISLTELITQGYIHLARMAETINL